MKRAPEIVRDAIVTNNELIKVLTQMGFRNESTEERYRFVNDKYNSIVHLPPRPLDEVVKNQFLAIYSYQLYMQGVIRDEENLVKKVLQNREKKKKPVIA